MGFLAVDFGLLILKHRKDIPKCNLTSNGKDASGN